MVRRHATLVCYREGVNIKCRREILHYLKRRREPGTVLGITTQFNANERLPPRRLQPFAHAHFLETAVAPRSAEAAALSLPLVRALAATLEA